MRWLLILMAISAAIGPYVSGFSIERSFQSVAGLIIVFGFVLFEKAEQNTRLLQKIKDELDGAKHR